jgi:hypothetical protein
LDYQLLRGDSKYSDQTNENNSQVLPTPFIPSGIVLDGAPITALFASVVASYYIELGVEGTIEVIGDTYGITMEVYSNPVSFYEELFCSGSSSGFCQEP